MSCWELLAPYATVAALAWFWIFMLAKDYTSAQKKERARALILVTVWPLVLPVILCRGIRSTWKTADFKWGRK